jgi:hypothetical protein
MKEMFVGKPAVMLIGGPETGKSNFLFKAWTNIDSGSGLIEKDGRLPLDAEYLQGGAESQLRGKYAGHTSHEVQVVSEIPIRLRSDKGKTALLLVPDIDGEQINRIFHARKWSGEWESLLKETTSYLLFVRVNSRQTVAPLDWVSCHQLYSGVAAPVAPEQNVAAVATPAEMPTQVILVDWLQFIAQAIHDKYPHSLRPRVGIIVTAWDSVAVDFQFGPSDWIKENFPLLHQFCMSNQETFEFAFFGSSIFSGDPETDPDFADELSKKDPRSLGYVRYPPDNLESKDFTMPIAWALGWQSMV